jgi:hypothetical protein
MGSSFNFWEVARARHEIYVSRVHTSPHLQKA